MSQSSKIKLTGLRILHTEREARRFGHKHVTRKRTLVSKIEPRVDHAPHTSHRQLFKAKKNPLPSQSSSFIHVSVSKPKNFKQLNKNKSIDPITKLLSVRYYFRI